MRRFLLNRSVLVLMLLTTLLAQAGCGYVAAGAAGAVIGHEAAEDDDE
jgi:hypothetical protein